MCLLKLTANSLRTRGVSATLKRIARKVLQRSGYQFQSTAASDPIKNRVKKHDFRQQQSWSRADGYRPVFSILLPVSTESFKSIRKTIESVRAQSYPHWTLTLIPVSRVNDSIAAKLENIQRLESRIMIQTFRSNEELTRIPSRENNFAYTGLARPGDRLTVDALYQIARVLECKPELDVLYTDEAHVDPRKPRSPQMILKPDWSPEMLLGYNYMGSFCVFRCSTFKRLGGFRLDLREAMEWDLCLRFMEDGCTFRHVPATCYIRETNRGLVPFGTTVPANQKQFLATLQGHLNRQCLPGRAEVCSNGSLRIRWSIKEKPLVSIIIPNKNHYSLIKTIINDLLYKTDYPNKEIVIVDNFSTDNDVLDFYQEQKKAGNIRVVPFNQQFNYSAACNTGAKAATGDVFLFLNNDMSVIDPNWLEELLGWALRPQAGVVGAKLLYPNGNVQQCGIVMGMYFLSHIWWKSPKAEWGNFGNLDTYRNYLAVTGACQMIRRDVFEELGGYDETYRIGYSDVALCISAISRGYRVCYTPHAELVHYESYTRTCNDIEDAQIMAHELIQTNYREDPYFHSNLRGVGPGPMPANFDPQLRQVHEETPRLLLDRWLHHLTSAKHEVAPIDLHNEEEICHLARTWGLTFTYPRYCPNKMSTDVDEAVAFILHVLIQDSKLRKQFPTALSDGVEGAFCQWLCTIGLQRYRLPSEASEAIRLAFDRKPLLQIRKLFSFYPEVREQHFTGLLPAGQRKFLRWLLSARPKFHKLSDQDILWGLLEASEIPLREFEFAYKTCEEWQKRVPGGMFSFGNNQTLKWLSNRQGFSNKLIREIRNRAHVPTIAELQLAYNIRVEWQMRFPQAFNVLSVTKQLLDWIESRYGISCASKVSSSEPSYQPRLGVNLLGSFCGRESSQNAAQLIGDAMKGQDVNLAQRDVPADFISDDVNRCAFLDLEYHDTTLIWLEPHIFGTSSYVNSVYKRAGLEVRPGVYRVAYWNVELEDLPLSNTMTDKLNEFWVPSTYAANILSTMVCAPVKQITPLVLIGGDQKLRRSELNIDQEDYVFAFCLNTAESIDRKNPLALIEAFKKAFRADDKVKLVIHVTSSDSTCAERKSLVELSKNAGVILVNDERSRYTSEAISRLADCFISLHRSESFGLHLAKAMLMAKPVIATNYSGNLEFMNDSNAMLVDCTLQPVKRRLNCEDLKSSRNPVLWADPNIESAANWMRWAFEHKDEASELGMNGQRFVENHFSTDAVAKQIVGRLEESTVFQIGHDSSKILRRVA